MVVAKQHREDGNAIRCWKSALVARILYIIEGAPPFAPRDLAPGNRKTSPRLLEVVQYTPLGIRLESEVNIVGYRGLPHTNAT